MKKLFLILIGFLTFSAFAETITVPSSATWDPYMPVSHTFQAGTWRIRFVSGEYSWDDANSPDGVGHASNVGLQAGTTLGSNIYVWSSPGNDYTLTCTQETTYYFIGSCNDTLYDGNAGSVTLDIQPIISTLNLSVTAENPFPQAAPPLPALPDVKLISTNYTQCKWNCVVTGGTAPYHWTFDGLPKWLKAFTNDPEGG